MSMTAAARLDAASTAASSRAALAPRLTSAVWTAAVVGLFGVLFAAWFAGWRIQRVDTGSMTPTIPQNSLTVISPASPLLIRRGDVISFRDPMDRRLVVVHRVIRVIDHEGSARVFQTQGDANATPDPLLVSARDVEGRVRFHVPRVGKIAWALRPPIGLLVFVGLPIAAALAGRRAAR